MIQAINQREALLKSSFVDPVTPGFSNPSSLQGVLPKTLLSVFYQEASWAASIACKAPRSAGAWLLERIEMSGIVRA